MVDGILQDAGNGAIVLRSDEDDSVRGCNFALQALIGRWLIRVMVLVIKAAIRDLVLSQGEFRSETCATAFASCRLYSRLRLPATTAMLYLPIVVSSYDRLAVSHMSCSSRPTDGRFRWRR